MKTQLIRISIFLAGMLIAASALAGKPTADIVVTGVDPSSAEQGQTLVVKVVGTGFEDGASIRFLVKDSKDDTQISAGIPTFIPADPEWDGTEWEGSDSLESTITVQPQALVTDYEVEVSLGKGRKGKGTTFFFTVKSNQATTQCSFEFEAEFRDAVDDGIRTDFPEDDPKSYVAIGGEGFRLDTNGSQKLERKNDTRWVRIDFSADAACDPALNPGAVAAGFCSELKGVDLRIEHQVQEPLSLCSLDWQDPDESSMPRTVVISFLSDPDGLDGDPDGLMIDPNQNGTGPQSLKLSYGCQAQFLDASYFDEGLQARVTRTSENTWTIEGWEACLVTQLSYPLQEPGVIPTIVNMPFKLTIVSQGAH